jgi:hypothetical protein
VEASGISLQGNGKIVGKIMEYLKLTEAKEKYECRPVFEVLIGERLRQVWSIDGYEHELGKANGEVPTWWVDLSEDEFNESELTPWMDRVANRICWGVDFKQFNTPKHKWDETNISGGGICKISANGTEVFSFRCKDLAEAMSSVVHRISEICQHPFNFLNPEEEWGRKIWYYGLPAIVEEGYEKGEMRIVPDHSYLSSEKWWKLLEIRKYPITHDLTDEEMQDYEIEKDRLEETKDCGEINHGSILYDGMIGWFRK